ncbi:MAG: hypothetical protein IZT57_04780 [Chloroflexi bacterium]|nr:hypothetical protein [Chloroflexota bacterium]
MARIKFGSIITEGHGSLGGHTIQNSRGGAQLRTKPINKKKPTAAQSLIRSYNPQLQYGWRALTEVQRSTWNAYAVSHQVLNKVHPVKVISGHSLWMSLQFGYISLGLPFQSDVFKAVTGALGSELVTNGDFNGISPWLISAGVVYSPGMVTFDGVANSYLAQNIPFSIGVSYMLSFTISSVLSVADIYFRALDYSRLFNPPVATRNTYPPGVNNVICTSLVDTTRIWFWLYACSCSYSISSVSIKEIL